MLEEAIKNTKGEGSVEVQPPKSRVDKRTPAERAFQNAREKRVSFLQYSKSRPVRPVTLSSVYDLLSLQEPHNLVVCSINVSCLLVYLR